MAKFRICVLASEMLFASFFDAQRQARLTRLARWELVTSSKLTPKMLDALQAADALITTWDSPFLDEQAIKALPNLRVIAHCGGEVKKRFSPGLFRKLTIVNTPEPMSRPTAELGAALLLYSARNIDHYRQALRKRSNRVYQTAHLTGADTASGPETLIGREIGMIGLGRIGRSLVQLLSGFNLRWIVHDPYVKPAQIKGLPVELCGLDSVIRRSSMLVLAAAATPKSKHLLNAKRLARLPDGAVLINIARGALVDLDALTKEVFRGRLRCAIDVTDPEEPLAVDHPLRSAPGAIVTPHIGGGGPGVRGEMADVAMDDLQRFFAGKPVRNRLTADMLDRMT